MLDLTGAADPRLKPGENEKLSFARASEAYRTFVEHFRVERFRALSIDSVRLKTASHYLYKVTPLCHQR